MIRKLVSLKRVWFFLYDARGLMTLNVAVYIKLLDTLLVNASVVFQS